MARRVMTILDLDADSLVNIVSKCPLNDFRDIALTCRAFAEATRDERMWHDHIVKEGDDAQSPAPYFSWRQRYIEVYMTYRFNPQKVHPEHVLDMQNRRLRRLFGTIAGKNDFQGAQLLFEFPDHGVYYFEATVQKSSNATSDRWVAVGVANDNLDPISCGWWSDNMGCGWYSASEVFAFDEEMGTQNTISDGDIIGCVVDRDRGRIAWYKNGVREQIVVNDERIKKEKLFPTFILLTEGSITVRRARVPDSFALLE